MLRRPWWCCVQYRTSEAQSAAARRSAVHPRHNKHPRPLSTGNRTWLRVSERCSRVCASSLRRWPGTNGGPACRAACSSSVEIQARGGSLLFARSSSWGACLWPSAAARTVTVMGHTRQCEPMRARFLLGPCCGELRLSVKQWETAGPIHEPCTVRYFRN